MASGPITSWQIDGETVETVTDFNFVGLQNHCRLWLQPWSKKTLIPWKESYDQPRQDIQKQRHYFVNKSPSSQGYGFSSGHVWMWELDCEESWALKNWCFELWCWRRLLRVPWTARRSNQSTLKEISPDYWLEGLMLNLKLQYLAPWCKELTHLKRPWCWERLKTGEGDHRGWDGWMTSGTRGTWVWASSGSWWWTEKPGLLQSMGSQRVSHDWVTELGRKLTQWVTEGFLDHVCELFASPVGMWDLISTAGIKPKLPALKTQNFNHWITKDVCVYEFWCLIPGNIND